MALKTSQVAGEKPTRHFEFFGPPGAIAITLGCPALLYFMVLACNDTSGCPVPSLLHPSTLTLDKFKQEAGWPADGFRGLLSWHVTGWTLGYYFFSMLLYRFLPGEVRDGTVLANGGRLKYKFNTLQSTGFTLALCLAGTIMQGAEFPVWTFISDNFLQLLTTNILIAWAVATFVYVRSFSVKPGNPELRELAHGGHTGNLIYDWFIGRELNPRITLPVLGEFDIKLFMELRPGMLGWMLINCAMIAKQYRTFGYVTDSIVFVTIVQAAYVFDSQVMEPAILTTIDITTDGFGNMLAFGDVAWLPFLYSTQARYLSVHPVQMGYLGTGLCALVALTGFTIFRLANSEKNRFRTEPGHPKVAHLKYIETKTGSRLLVSGWWGLSRHINYLGDWFQGWSYSLPTGLAGYVILSAGSNAPGSVKMLDGREVVSGEAKGWGMLFTYLYLMYFAVLLVHRQRRDDAKCMRKYGEDWDEYMKRVPSRIIPGIY